MAAKRMEFLKEVAPTAKRVAIPLRAAQTSPRRRKRYGNFRAHGAIATATDDRYAAFAGLEQRLDNIPANGEQEVRLLRNKFGCQSLELIRFTIGIAEDDFDVATINKSGLSECIFSDLSIGPNVVPPNTSHPIVGFCACTVRGQAAAALPRSVMNSCRLMPIPRLRTAHERGPQ
jgi:hypothetical protein